MNEKDRLEQLFSLFYSQNASAKEIDEFFRLIEDVPNEVLEALAHKYFEAGKEQELLFPSQLREKLYAKIIDVGNIPAPDGDRNNFIRHFARFGWAAAVIAAILIGVLLYPWTGRQGRDGTLADAANKHQHYLKDTSAVQVHGTADTVGSALAESVINVAELTRLSGVADGFSTITVPYGKRSELMLPDSSKVWLNAGSQLTFPSVFDASNNEVFLIGEGYFEVTERKTTPFYVRTADMNIKVMGTSFNVSAYPDDGYTSAVLLSGKIEIEPASTLDFQNIAIAPGTSAMLNRTDKKLKIQRVTAEDEISWTKRQLILKNTQLSEILTRLSRIYNAEIVDNFGRDSAVTFSGKLDLTMPLTDVLKIIYDSNGEYQINQIEGRYVISE
ncbi:FecR family protein [Parapedobacter pyrenivorans]|uniref:FecR family protein n=1 Tax=Parapedobacter pyrenivorans TaxID=1305674 RepID=UPI00333F0112